VPGVPSSAQVWRRRLRVTQVASCMCSQVLSATANDQDPGDLDSRLKKKKNKIEQRQMNSVHTRTRTINPLSFGPQIPRSRKGRRASGVKASNKVMALYCLPFFAFKNKAWTRSGRWHCTRCWRKGPLGGDAAARQNRWPPSLKARCMRQWRALNSNNKERRVFGLVGHSCTRIQRAKENRSSYNLEYRPAPTELVRP
jgi:hypothetical protein